MIAHHWHKLYVQDQNYALGTRESTPKEVPPLQLPEHTEPILLSRDGVIVFPSWKMLEQSYHVWDESWARDKGWGKRRFSAAGHRNKGSSVLPVKFLCITGTWGPVRSDQEGTGNLIEKGLLNSTIDLFLKCNSSIVLGNMVMIFQVLCQEKKTLTLHSHK